MNLSEQISEKILSLESALLTQNPTMPTLLNDIWKTLKENPDNVTLLSEQEIGVIVNGLKRQTSTEIATAALKSATKKSAKSITLSDL
jgi:hypothetical protein